MWNKIIRLYSYNIKFMDHYICYAYFNIYEHYVLKYTVKLGPDLMMAVALMVSKSANRKSSSIICFLH